MSKNWEDTNELFVNGLRLYREEEYLEAEKILKQAYASKTHRRASAPVLVNLYLKTGRFNSARKVVNTIQNPTIQSQLTGILEEYEYNFMNAENCYFELFSDTDNFYSALLSIAKLYINLGRLGQAYNILEKILSMPKNQDKSGLRTSAYFNMIYIYIYKKAYTKAYELLSKVDLNLLDPDMIEIFYNTKIYLLHFIGVMIDDNYRSYYVERLMDPNDFNLLYHIGKHKKLMFSPSGYVFLNNIDLIELIIKVKSKIREINPIYFVGSEKYRFILDEPIGVKGKVKTNAIEVVVISGTDIILTMYPIEVSKEFDIEGLSTSKILRNDRINGGIIL